MIFKIDVGHHAKNAAYVFRCLCQPLRIAAWCSVVSPTASRWLALLEPCREVSQMLMLCMSAQDGYFETPFRVLGDIYSSVHW